MGHCRADHATPSRRPAATHAIISRPWKRRLVNDFGFHLMHEFFGYRVDNMHAPADSTATVLDGEIAEWMASVHRDDDH